MSHSPSDATDDKWVALVPAIGVLQAQIIISMLETLDIPAYIDEAYGIFGQASPSRIYVRQSQYETAITILRENYQVELDRLGLRL